MAFIKNCSHDYLLNHTGIFQLSPFATWFQETMPKYFVQMLVILEEFFLHGLETWHLGIKNKLLRPEDKFSAAGDMMCLGAREGEMAFNSL